MPVKTAEQLREKTVRLKNRMAEKAETMDGPALRNLKKQIRRAQRRRRKIEAAQARATAKKAAEAAAPAGAPAPAATEDEPKAE